MRTFTRISCLMLLCFFLCSASALADEQYNGAWQLFPEGFSGDVLPEIEIDFSSLTNPYFENAFAFGLYAYQEMSEVGTTEIPDMLVVLDKNTAQKTVTFILDEFDNWIADNGSESINLGDVPRIGYFFKEPDQDVFYTEYSYTTLGEYFILGNPAGRSITDERDLLVAFESPELTRVPLLGSMFIFIAALACIPVFASVRR